MECARIVHSAVLGPEQLEEFVPIRSKSFACAFRLMSCLGYVLDE